MPDREIRWAFLYPTVIKHLRQFYRLPTLYCSILAATSPRQAADSQICTARENSLNLSAWPVLKFYLQRASHSLSVKMAAPLVLLPSVNAITVQAKQFRLRAALINNRCLSYTNPERLRIPNDQPLPLTAVHSDSASVLLGHVVQTEGAQKPASFNKPTNSSSDHALVVL